MEFKVGDRVRAIKDYDGADHEPQGEGLVIVVSSNKSLTVLFPKWKHGHDFNLIYAPEKYHTAEFYSSCWCYSRESALKCLKKVPRTLREIVGDKNV